MCVSLPPLADYSFFRLKTAILRRQVNKVRRWRESFFVLRPLGTFLCFSRLHGVPVDRKRTSQHCEAVEAALPSHRTRQHSESCSQHNFSAGVPQGSVLDPSLIGPNHISQLIFVNFMVLFLLIVWNHNPWWITSPLSDSSSSNSTTIWIKCP